MAGVRKGRIPVLNTTLRFSTENVPPAERLPTWYEVFDRSVSRRELSPFSDDPFHMQVTVSNLQDSDATGARNTGVCVQRMNFTTGFSARRARDLLADGNDDLILYIQQAGRRTVSQLGREAAVEPGGAVLSSNAEASTTVVPGPSRFACIAVPRRPLTALVPNLDDLLVRPLPADAGVLQLLESYLAVLEDRRLSDTPALQHAVVTHIHDLVAVVLGSLRDHIEVASGRGIRAARLHAIKADIARNLTDGDVSAGALAVRHRVTARYIHKLFESEGTTLSRFVLGQRLSRVHRMLTDVRNTGRTIGELAFAAGFGDLSTFNHAFRRHYGARPSDVRANALSGGANASTWQQAA
jgi:AraC-like DNA-binding protein